MKNATPQGQTPGGQPEGEDRKPGRSFDDPSRPMGEGVLARSPKAGSVPPADFASGEAQADTSAKGVAERATAIGVLRKVEELIADNNPGATDEASLRRCFELAVGRVGIKIGEYEALVKGDPELMKLEKNVLDAARAHFVAAPQ